MALNPRDGAAGAAAGPTRVAPARRPATWPARTAGWIAERHGLPVLGPTVVLYALALGAGANETRGLPGGRVEAWQILLGGAAFWAWYLMLRVLDDLEDAPADAVVHPDRRLARGLVDRGDLWRLAAVCAGFGLAAALLLDASTTTWTITSTWLAGAAVLGVVAIDFGAPTVLAARPLRRRLLRLPVSMVPLAWAYAVGTLVVDGDVPAPTGLPVAALLLTGLFVLATFDVSRKFGPSRPGEVSWPAALGDARAHRLLGALVGLAGLTAALLVVTADGRWHGTIAPALCGLTVVGAADVAVRRDAGAASVTVAMVLALALVSLVGGAA